MIRRVVIPALSFALVATTATAQLPTSTNRDPELTANGRGETRITPDYAFVTIGVTNQAANAVEAASENAKRFDAILASLRSYGLVDRELVTSRYNLEQNYEYPKNQVPKLAGFTARSTIRAEVRHLADLGKIIDASIASGATNIIGVQFLATSTDEARRTAMTEAVRQARLDADAMARAAGGSLGRLLSLNSSNVSEPVMIRGASAQLQSTLVAGNSAYFGSAPPPTAIAPGELIVSAMVFGRWEFVPAGAR
ncbi:MAG TPA: SIMPL domain-containing protein [Gemmatimonadaceae bacterium]